MKRGIELVRLIEEGIDQLALEFREQPYNFYTETDMHLFLYGILQSKFGFKYKTKDGVQINLIHTEFPTYSRYRVDKQHFFHPDPNGVRGAFDLVVWDPDSLPSDIDEMAVWRPKFGEERRPRLLAAIECKLYEGLGKYLSHVHNDFIKLDEPTGQIQHKYMIQFVRNMIKARRYLEYFEPLRYELNRVKGRGVNIRYVEVRRDAEPIDSWIK